MGPYEKNLVFQPGPAHTSVGLFFCVPRGDPSSHESMGSGGKMGGCISNFDR